MPTGGKRRAGGASPGPCHSTPLASGYPRSAGMFHRMRQTAHVKVAVVDVGTNSTRVLVAEVEDGRVRELDRRTIVTRLGEGVDSTGRLGEGAMARVFEACAKYR